MTVASYGLDQSVDWIRVAPTLSAASPSPNFLAASVWTNANSGNLSCTYTPLAANGPTASAFKVALTNSTLAHPGGADLSGCNGTGQAFAPNVVVSGQWTYTLDTAGSAAWKAGTYQTVVTYTAQGI
jgi:hypothetical protein